MQKSESRNLEARTTGLGFASEERALSRDHMLEHAHIVGMNVEAQRRGSVSAVEAMNADSTIEMVPPVTTLKLKTSECPRSAPKSKIRKNFGRDVPDNVSRGYLSIGGVKVWTELGITDDSEELDEEPDVRADLDLASAKGRGAKGSQKNSWKRKKELRRHSTTSLKGQRLQDSSCESEKSVIDSSNSDIDDELAEDYLANVGGSSGSVNATWLLRNRLFEQVRIEDMAMRGGVDEKETTSTDTSASEINGDSCHSDYAASHGWCFFDVLFDL